MIIDGFEIPDNADDTREWYSHAADQAAQHADDDNSRRANGARRELRAARAAMAHYGLRPFGSRT